MMVDGTVKRPFAIPTCGRSCIAVGPTLPTAAVLYPLSRATESSDASRTKLPPNRSLMSASTWSFSTFGITVPGGWPKLPAENMGRSINRLLPN